MDQSQGAARGRLDRALPGSGVSGRKTGLLAFGLTGSSRVDDEEDSGVSDLDPDKNSRSLFCNVWSIENESSTKFESHSNSAKSSYCNKISKR